MHCGGHLPYHDMTQQERHAEKPHEPEQRHHSADRGADSPQAMFCFR
jgi:hypothetical protein